jgi:uncharacterized protein YecE (DUF72 family)
VVYFSRYDLATAILAMWKLTPEYIEQVKEELKGRRAAIQARHADELRALEEDIAELESLEKLAYAVAVKHVPISDEAEDLREPELPAIAELQGSAAEPADVATARPEPEVKGLSRWRMRLDATSENEPV